MNIKESIHHVFCIKNESLCCVTAGGSPFEPCLATELRPCVAQPGSPLWRLQSYAKANSGDALYKLLDSSEDVKRRILFG